MKLKMQCHNQNTAQWSKHRINKEYRLSKSNEVIDESVERAKGA